MSQKFLQTHAKGLMLGTMLVTAGLCSSCQEAYELDEKLPPNFGSNLMTYLEQNNFKNYVQLVDDLGYRDALAGVSLKTLFAADDDAFERFYANNEWGVKSYADLSLAQKKMLLYGSMLDNSLQVMNLSSTTGSEGVVVGNAVRRHTASSVFDTVPVISPDQMPDNNPSWDYYRKNGKSIVCMKDASYTPLVFFTEPYLANKKITNEDMKFMFNGRERKSGDAYIGETYIEKQNIRSANGFIHQTHDVVARKENMAEMIRTNPNDSIFSRLLFRFCAPYFLGEVETDRYNLEYGTKIDSLFALGFFSKHSAGPGTRYPDGRDVDELALLKFDPGWNSLYSMDVNVSGTVAMQQDMCVMLVPTDKAMQDYWENGVGASIRDFYGDWDNVPDKVVAKLINNVMKESWVSTVPSKFADVVNDNTDPMRITTADVDMVSVACNGAIYWTNKVFSPTEYISVSFPALINPSMSILYWAIENKEYRSYLNSLDSYYSFFLPSNDAMKFYVDPVTYKNGINNEIWKVYYDENSTDRKIWASRWRYNLTTGEIGDSIKEPVITGSDGRLLDRLEDLLDNHIVVGNRSRNGNVENGHEYYRTKNGGVIRMKKEGDAFYVQGTLQMDQNRWLKVSEVYDESKDGNGKTYILGKDSKNPSITPEPLMTTRKSVFDVLSEHEEFSVFYNLLYNSPLRQLTADGTSPIASTLGNVKVFRNYHYTLYVPSNESLNKLIAEGKLPTWADIETKKEQGLDYKSDSAYLENFLRYHIQDNLLMLGMDYSADGGILYDKDGNPIVNSSADVFERPYETAFINVETKKFYTLDVNMQGGNTAAESELYITDLVGNTRKVQKIKDADGQNLYNLLAREYNLGGDQISATSFASIHLIDGPLFYENTNK